MSVPSTSYKFSKCQKSTGNWKDGEELKVYNLPTSENCIKANKVVGKNIEVIQQIFLIKLHTPFDSFFFIHLHLSLPLINDIFKSTIEKNEEYLLGYILYNTTLGFL